MPLNEAKFKEVNDGVETKLTNGQFKVDKYWSYVCITSFHLKMNDTWTMYYIIGGISLKRLRIF